MPFTETTLMDERLCFVAACLRGDEAMTSLCLRYGISRKTGYKWLGRYEEFGVVGLEDRSRAPRTVPQGLAPEVVADILRLREQNPTWGPRKLLARLKADVPAREWPAISTVGDLLKRKGLTRSRPDLRRARASDGPVVEASSSNESWSADFKGWFRTGNGTRCEPLTISDNYSRYLFTCHAVPRVTHDLVRPHFEKAFRDHGLPRAIRTDNGPPFAHRLGLGGLTRLSVWFLMLGIWPDRITPGRPDQNGRHERMHRTLAEDVARPPAETLALQQDRMDCWRQTYNTRRPHEALDQKTPAQVHQPSPRPYPEAVAAWDYPEDHHVRKVNAQGRFRWRDSSVYLSEAFVHETIGIALNDLDEWTVRFRGFDLGILDVHSIKIRSSVLARSGQHGTNQESCNPCPRSKV